MAWSRISKTTTSDNRARRADEEPVAVTVEGENPIIGLTGTFEA